jgi:hypothetical protein
VLVGNLFPQACSVQLYFWLAGFIWLVWLFDLYTSNIWSKKKKELSVCQSLLCLDLVSFPVLSQIKPQAPLLVVPFRQFL